MNVNNNFEFGNYFSKFGNPVLHRIIQEINEISWDLTIWVAKFFLIRRMFSGLNLRAF